jgi:hypothetical protein
MNRTTKLLAATALGTLMMVAACHNDELLPPPLQPVNPLFAHYVSMGNSITAGFQSGGINDSTQLQSYAELLAQRMRARFFSPLMARPGCPPPFINIFTQTRISTIPCALRIPHSPPLSYVTNVAVPGAEVMDAISNLDAASNANALTTFFLGTLTQTQMMQRVQPTFVTVWLGNNDVLGAATNGVNAGDSALITAPALFQARYTEVADSLLAAGVEGVVLIGVANVTAVPYLSQGQTYFAIKNGAIPGVAFPDSFKVGLNCAPIALGGKGDSVLVPFPFGAGLLAQAAAGVGTTLNCTEPQTIQPAELTNLAATVAAYNSFIQTHAGAHGWAYLDPNAAFDSLRLVPNQVAAFPNFGNPAGSTTCAASPFGLGFSCDGIHPSAATHKLIANKLIEAINAKYGTSLARIP